MKLTWREAVLIFSSVVLLFCMVEGGPRMRRQSLNTETKRIVCFYAFWASKRPGQYRFVPNNIDPTLCTHIMYSYARVEPNEGIVAYDFKADIEDEGWASMVKLKTINPRAKILLSIGGLFEGSSRFTRMAADIGLRKVFVDSAARTLREFGFDGIDMSWFFPGFSEGSSSADKENYVSLMKELKEELKDEFIISMSVPALIQYIDSGFDIPRLLMYAEYFNVLAYSYHDSTDAAVNHHGPLYSLPTDPDNKNSNVDATIREYIKRGARPDQLNLVIPLYGVAFVLENPEENEIGAPTEDEGIGLEEPGALIYFELCQRIRKESWTVKKVNSSAMGPYAYKDRLWVAYDDEDMVRTKARYAVEKGLGGMAFWTVDQDDFRGQCHVNNFPLLRAGREVFLAGELNNNLDQEIPVVENQPTPTTSKPSTNRLTTIPTTRTTTTSSISVQPIVDQRGRRPPDNFWTSDGDIFINPERTRSGVTVYRSNRDIVFSDFKIWIANHYQSPGTDRF